jgi:hypothetical protein
MRRSTSAWSVSKSRILSSDAASNRALACIRTPAEIRR